MTTITREQALKIIEAADEVISALAGTNEDVHPGSDNMLRLWDDLNDRYAPPEVVRELARIVLASLEADPVAYIFKHPAGKLFWALTDESNKEQADVIPVYAAAPASVVPDNASEPLAYAYKELTPEIMRNQAAESNRGNEWTGNPDIDNAIIMLDRIDTAESCDDERIEAVKAVLRRLAGNSPVTPDGLSTVCAEAYQVVGVMADALGVFGDAAVQKVLDNLSQQKLVHRDVLPFSLPVTPDGWISCSERMPNDAQWCVVNTEYGYYVQCWSEGQGWLGDDISIPECDVINWMPLPEPPKEVNRG
ncbi:DUF551 domain-containing protein [Shigella flexneri]|nr:DUF551 domain-containing protein [Shigella flexneri]